MVESWAEARARDHARKANLTQCRNCGAAVYRGLDADTAALTVEIDAAPITLIGEYEARLNRRRIYDLAGGEIHHRENWNTAFPPRPVYAEHVCPPSDQLTLDASG